MEKAFGTAAYKYIEQFLIDLNGNIGGRRAAGLENYRGGPKTVRDALGQSNKFAQEMIKCFKELKQDGMGKKAS